MINLKEINRNNFYDVIDLSVNDDQKEFVASNLFSLAQAKTHPECIPLAVYNDDLLVGFVMYCLDVQDNEYWIYRLMVDKKYQHMGYGRKALNCLIEIITKDKKHDKIYLSFEPENLVAKSLYEDLGFTPDGRVIQNEIVYCLNI